MEENTSLRVRRHLRLFERDVLSYDGVELLQFELALHRSLVLPRVVRKAGTSRRNEADVVAHSGPLVPRLRIPSKQWVLGRRPAD